MINKNLIHILTILEAIEKINIYTSKFDSEEEFYDSDDQLQFNAVLKLLSVIGEECNKIDSAVLNHYHLVNWRAIKDMRNRIVHDYRGIDPFLIFSIVKEELLILKSTLILVFGKLKHDLSSEDLKSIINSDYYKHLTYLL